MNNLKPFKYICLLIPILFFTSCGEDFAFTTKYNYLEEETKAWSIPDSLNKTSFEMVDNKGISSTFNELTTQISFSTGQSGFLFIPVRKSQTENIYISCNSNYGLNFSMYLYAGFDVFGDYLNMNLGETNFSYDFKYKELSSVGIKNAYISRIVTDEGLEGEKIFSKVEIIDNYTIGDKKYAQVLHFRLNDFETKIDIFTITDIYYAKQIGLIKYSYPNRVTMVRK